ncbi:hypothetical protein FACS1894205_0730 [Alphaproteobacteria bacterium]|nr:hypothetical protein FACS1894205_0730 [Alphaproteobacteria bacterium]
MGRKTDDDGDDLPVAALSVMSERSFAAWGLENVAYVKRIGASGALGWAIYGADGGALGVADNRTLAFAAIRQHDMEPLSVH